MSVFALRSSDAASALRSSPGDTLRLRTYTAGWHLYIDGVDAITRVPLEAWRITDAGPNSIGRLEADHLDQSRTYPIPAGALVELVDGDGAAVYWTGYIGSRDVLPFFPAGQLTRITAVDIGQALDTAYIVSDQTAAGMTDREAVQYLVGRYGRRGVYAPDVTVEVTDTSLPALSYGNQTLREALRIVRDAAGEDRTFWVDRIGRVNYGATAVIPAPYAITDGTPDGTTTIAVSELAIEYDESTIVNRVLVTNGQATYSKWVEDASSIAIYGVREGWLTNDAVVDVTTANLFGLAYLARVATPAVRGSFAVDGWNGWAAGQALTVTSTPLGLAAATYLITDVTTEWQIGTGRRRYRVNFGELPRSLVRAISRTIG